MRVRGFRNREGSGFGELLEQGCLMRILGTRTFFFQRPLVSTVFGKHGVAWGRSHTLHTCRARAISEGSK